MASTPPLPAHYRDGAKKIISAVLAGNDAYRKLTELCDGIGHRLSGSKALDRAIAWAEKTLRADGHENVRREKVMVQRWLRGAASLQMLAPQRRDLPLLALGGSVSTPRGGVKARLLVVNSWKELEAQGAKVRGRIVLFNDKMLPFTPKRGVGYGRVVQYRYDGAARAGNLGAVAVLVRSPTAHSLRTPHTGAMSYRKLAKGKRKIAAAAITTEDADMLARLQKAGREIELRLRLSARTARAKVPSANVVAELRGRDKPDEIVLIGGHIDSWDVGQGAHDDGAGCVMAMEALAALRRLGMRPRRTVRVVLFTNEENGLGGAKAYARDHKSELSKHAATIEADTGAFEPRGFSLAMKDKARQKRAAKRLRQVVSALAPIGATRVWTGHSGADLWPMKKLGVLTMGLRMDISHYFDYHHTRADTLDKVDPRHLTHSTASLAAMAWLLAELPDRLDDTRRSAK
ncbi:MAG: M20/M25/M40 family metallo-hydrolase [Myxococcales bacterium]|nr:M20/M25/M40 family metallo-hydrolase [Myxococcales bacterium]